MGRENMNPREYLEILHLAEKLKDITRHCTTSNRRGESVADSISPAPAAKSSIDPSRAGYRLQ